jgi:PAS domain S-box-containing protein
LSPGELAERLADAGVEFAALTDHDTVDGLDRFRAALARRGVGFITGIELTASHDGHVLHLLGYGFDPAHARLVESLQRMRQDREGPALSVADAARRPAPVMEPGRPAPDALLPVGQAIELLHEAGGVAFLAHPLLPDGDLDRLEGLLRTLKPLGLDGLEVFYAPFTPEQRATLAALAERHGLLSSGGTDTHDRGQNGKAGPGIEMETAAWKAFRQAACFRVPAVPARAVETSRPTTHRLHWGSFALHVMVPTLLAITLFVAALFAVFLPALEESLLDRKRETIRELTNSAWSILADQEREERRGTVTRDDAQRLAKSRVEALRYGREGKDYFWLQDMHPRIVMHPYRPDLNGQDVSEFKDPRGARIFVEFANLVRRKEQGTVAYVWQWKDDPGRMVPKESYVRGFAPWGWVIGTGLYIEDVQREITRIESRLVNLSIAISVLLALLLFYVVQQSLRLERRRTGAEQELRESNERYLTLVEATTEGTLLVLEGRCRYANPVMLALLGYSARELSLLDLSDICPPREGNGRFWEGVDHLARGEESPEPLEGALRRRDGTMSECVLELRRVSTAGRSGVLVLAKQLRPRLDGATGRDVEQRLRQLGEAAEVSSVGIFCARPARGGLVVVANDTAARLLRLGRPGDDHGPVSLADILSSPADLVDLMGQMERDGTAERRRILVSCPDARTRTLGLRASLSRDEQGRPHLIHGIIEDVTLADRLASEREEIIGRLQTSMLFLHEPLGRATVDAVTCGLETPVRKVAALMNERRASAVLVSAEGGPALGILTDRDLRERVVATGEDTTKPVFRFMSAPLVTIQDHAVIYEALLAMEEHGVQHLAVQDDAGRVSGMVRHKELIQFQRYGPLVLVREILRAATVEEVARSCRRVPPLARALLDCGARPRNITRMVASICDAATERLVAIAMKELGSAPTPFAFVAFGSQGRQEQTLFTDQDNGIIHGAAVDVPASDVTSYFAELGRRVCDGLDQAGYRFCPGNVMAKNPQWCLPLEGWKGSFGRWVLKAEPQEIMELSIFFDFRVVMGEVELGRDLRRHVQATLRQNPAFYPWFAQSALTFKPPVWLLGRLIVGGGGGDHGGSLDLKDAMMPLVNFARLYALRHDLGETHTLDRLDALRDRDVISESTHGELATAYDFLVRLRLRQQSDALHAGLVPDNLLALRKLGSTEETVLKQALAQVGAAQKKISHDFLGDT